MTIHNSEFLNCEPVSRYDAAKAESRTAVFRPNINLALFYASSEFTQSPGCTHFYQSKPASARIIFALSTIVPYLNSSNSRTSSGLVFS